MGICPRREKILENLMALFSLVMWKGSKCLLSCIREQNLNSEFPKRHIVSKYREGFPSTNTWRWEAALGGSEFLHLGVSWAEVDYF